MGYVVVNVESINPSMPSMPALTVRVNLTVVIMKSGDKHSVQIRAPERRKIATGFPSSTGMRDRVRHRSGYSFLKH
jgi:hypothetical protein